MLSDIKNYVIFYGCYVEYHLMWHAGAVVMGLGLVIKSSWVQLPAVPLRCNGSGQIVPLSVTTQYDLVVDKGHRCFAGERVTVGLVGSNGSLLQF